MNKNIVILGGGGFVGSHLIEALIAKKYNPILIVRSESKTKFNDKCKVIRYSEIGEDLSVKVNFQCHAFICLAWKGVNDV